MLPLEEIILKFILYERYSAAYLTVDYNTPIFSYIRSSYQNFSLYEGIVGLSAVSGESWELARSQTSKIFKGQANELKFEKDAANDIAIL
jgi:hypothetical protein